MKFKIFCARSYVYICDTTVEILKFYISVYFGVFAMLYYLFFSKGPVVITITFKCRCYWSLYS